MTKIENILYAVWRGLYMYVTFILIFSATAHSAVLNGDVSRCDTRDTVLLAGRPFVQIF